MTKLHELQKAIKPITKDSENPFFKSKYFDINAIIENIKPIIDKMGIVITQPLTVVEGKNVLKTLVCDNNGDILAESSIVIPEATDPQKMGSIITYFRRYSLQSLLFLQAEDDDGNRASIRVQTQTLNLLKLLIQNAETLDKLNAIFSSKEFKDNFKMLDTESASIIRNFTKTKKDHLLTTNTNGNQSN